MARADRTIVLERVHPHAKVPHRATGGSAGYDLASVEEVVLRAGRVTLVRTGWRMRAPKGYFLEVRPRSGLSSKGVLMANAPGTIDRDYAGEIFVPLTYLFRGGYRIAAGDRIGQMRLVTDRPARFRLGAVRPVGTRRGGFGSTGR